MGKWIFLIVLVTTTSAYSKSEHNYFFEWTKNNRNILKAKRYLKKYKIPYSKTSWMLNLTSIQAKRLWKTKAFKYLERDRVEKMIHFEENPQLVNTKNLNLSQGWHLKRINVEEAWKQTKGSPSVIVAVCDSGINANHKAFKGRVLSGWNFIDNNDDTSPNTNHGTAVSGFIGANNEQGAGASGVAPNISLLPGKIVTTSGGVPTSAMLDCIRWAADRGAKVINVSMTGVNSSASATAARYANRKGALVVWAAGNQNYYTKWRDKSEIIAVGATDIEDQRYYTQVVRDNGTVKNFGSNTGYFVDIAAPGEEVFTHRIDESFLKSNGTSYAAPIVTGVAALVYSVNPSLRPWQVRDILKRSTYYLGNQRSFGMGIVNAGRAVDMAKSSL